MYQLPTSETLLLEESDFLLQIEELVHELLIGDGGFQDAPCETLPFLNPAWSREKEDFLLDHVFWNDHVVDKLAELPPDRLAVAQLEIHLD